MALTWIESSLGLYVMERFGRRVPLIIVSHGARFSIGSDCP